MIYFKKIYGQFFYVAEIAEDFTPIHTHNIKKAKNFEQACLKLYLLDLGYLPIEKSSINYLEDEEFQKIYKM